MSLVAIILQCIQIIFVHHYMRMNFFQFCNVLRILVTYEYYYVLFTIYFNERKLGKSWQCVKKMPSRVLDV